MYTKLLTVLFCIVIGQLFGQSSKKADDLFNNFEYADAIQAYKELDADKGLSEERQEKLAFCYYITGNYRDGLPFIKSVMSENDNRAHFWLWRGTLEKESGNYDDAIASLNTFKGKSSELHQEVDVMIQSCEQIRNWEPLARHSVSLMAGNGKFADSYSNIEGETIRLREFGLDSAGNMMSATDTTNVELLLMRPFNSSEDQFRLFDNFPNLSVNRIQVIPSQNKLIFSATDQLSKKNILRSPQIYTADYSSLSTPVENVSLWTYSGLKDTSSYSHPAISSDGTLMVFTKSSTSTQGSDLFVSSYSNGEWSKPVELKSLNTFGNEMFPLFQGDSVLTFSTDGRVGYGGLDIFSVSVNEGDVSDEVYHYHAPVNSTMDDFNLSWTDSLNGELVSNRLGSVGDDDLWAVNIEPVEIPEPVVEVDDGFREWYDKWNLKPIYFDFDSFEAEANKEFIDGCIKYMEKYGLEVKLVGHTDCRGSERYNYKLGLNRSNWLKDQLVAAKVLNSITTESVGEKQLVNGCTSNSKCTEEEHRLNRFVEIQLTANENIPE